MFLHYIYNIYKMHIATNSAGILFRSSGELQSLVFLEFKPKLTHTHIYLQMQLSPAEQFLCGEGGRRSLMHNLHTELCKIYYFIRSLSDGGIRYVCNFPSDLSQC